MEFFLQKYLTTKSRRLFLKNIPSQMLNRTLDTLLGTFGKFQLSTEAYLKPCQTPRIELFLRKQLTSKRSLLFSGQNFFLRKQLTVKGVNYSRKIPHHNSLNAQYSAHKRKYTDHIKRPYQMVCVSWYHLQNLKDVKNTTEECYFQ